MQQRTLSFVFCACLIFLAAFVTSAHAAAIAKVIAAMPGVQVERNGQVHNLALKDAVYVNDVIRTNATGKVQLLFNDDSVVTIGINSSFSMSDFSSTQRKAFKAHLHQGFARFVTGVIVKNNPEAFTVRTPQATAGIRGTTLAVQISGQQTIISTENSTHNQSVVVNDTVVNAGYRAIFGPNSTLISGPKPMTNAQRQQIIQQARIVLNNSLNTPQGDLKQDDLQLPLGNNLDAGGNNLNTLPEVNLGDDLGKDFDDDLGDDLDKNFDDDLDDDLKDDLDDDFEGFHDDLDDDSLNAALLQENLFQSDLNATVAGEFEFSGAGGDSEGAFSFEANLKSGAISGASLNTTDSTGGNFTVINGAGQITPHNFTVSGGNATLDGAATPNWNMTGDKTIGPNTEEVEGTLFITPAISGEFEGNVKPK